MKWETVGFEKIKDNFLKLYENGKLGHAYLFSGQEMIGKKTFALELAQKINKTLIPAEENPDLFYVFQNSLITIDKTRDLKKFTQLKPHTGPYKFAIIDNAHLITAEAGNSILKILEEPPQSSIIILIAPNSGQVLPTILSRCEKVKFPPHPPNILREYFKNLKLTKEQAEFLMQFSNGRIGLAIDLHRKNALPLIKEIIKDFHNLVSSPLYKRFDFIKKLFDGKLEYDADMAVKFWMLYLRSPFSQNLKVARFQMLQKMLKLHYYLNQPQLNHKLLFENELINLSYV